MKAIVIFTACVALQLSIIPNVIGASTNLELLDKMARKGKLIDGILKPSQNGSLGEGSYGITYKGQFLPHNNMEVAMKFTSPNRVRNARKEFDIYTYLGAIDNPDVEANGIPSIYYYGRHNSYTVLAMKLLDSEFQKSVRAGTIKKSDVYVAFREFVRVIKYIHSKGVIHNAIAINNILIQNGRGFIFDFDSSVDMNENSFERNVLMVKYDFRRFLLSIFELVSPRSNWDWLGISQKEGACRMMNRKNFIAKLLDEFRSGEEFTGLRRIFVEFARHAFDDDSTGSTDANGKRIPFYDQIYQVIFEECEKFGNEAKTSISSISSIPDPFSIHKWDRPKVDYTLFENRYEEQRRTAKEEESGCLCFK